MIVTTSNFSNECSIKGLDASSTRTFLEELMQKSFDPELLPHRPLHSVETARFIAEQSRKLRVAAIASGQTSLTWMIENLYYEAYTKGCSRGGKSGQAAAISAVSAQTATLSG